MRSELIVILARRLLTGRADRLHGFARDSRGLIAIIYALLLMPLVLFASLAIDFSFYVNAEAQLNLAADAAAMHAVRVATQYYADNTTTTAVAAAKGVTAGQQWFAAQVGSLGVASVPDTDINISVAYSSTAPGGFSATVSYSGTVNTHLGAFIRKSWNIANTAKAQASNQYLEVLMMLDNSSSMQIAATEADQKTMMTITPCNSNNAFPTGKVNAINQGYPGYRCTDGTNSYTGTLTCPFPVSAPYTYSTLAISTYSYWWVTGGGSCQGWLPKQSDGTYPNAGPPCAFACHFDTSKPAGTGNDFYSLARSTLGTANAITLRFDLLKTATNSLLKTMSTAAASTNNLSVGIYTFNSSLTQVYPPSGQGEAGTDFTTAIAAVGLPPTKPNTADTGIQPDSFVSSTSHADTDFAGAMDSLASTVSASGAGTTASAPRKVLIIITDGYQDSGTDLGAFDYSKCTTFKNMGYTVYVVYTPYQPLMWYYYYQNQQSVVEGTGPGTVSYNLQKCASSASDYVAASDGPALTTALKTFLTSAANTAARVTQ